MILSEKTVKNYVSKLLAKLGMSRADRGGRVRGEAQPGARRPLMGIDHLTPCVEEAGRRATSR